MPGDWPSLLGSLRYGGNVCLRRLCLPPAAGCRGLTLPLGLGLRLMSKKGGQFPIVSWRRRGSLALTSTKGGKNFSNCPPKLYPPVLGLRGMVEMSAGTSGNRMIRNKARIVPPRLQSKVMAKRSFGAWLPSVPDASVLP